VGARFVSTDLLCRAATLTPTLSLEDNRELRRTELQRQRSRRPGENAAPLPKPPAWLAPADGVGDRQGEFPAASTQATRTPLAGQRRATTAQPPTAAKTTTTHGGTRHSASKPKAARASAKSDGAYTALVHTGE
jgi:hypothetical protein